MQNERNETFELESRSIHVIRPPCLQLAADGCTANEESPGTLVSSTSSSQISNKALSSSDTFGIVTIDY